MSAAATRLSRALRADAEEAGAAVTLAPLASRPWHAGLFSGETHIAELTGPDDRATAAWLAALPDRELPVRGHVVDAAVAMVARDGGRLTATLHLQTIEA